MPLVLNSREFAAYHRKLAERFRPAVLRGVYSGAQRAVGYLVQRTREAPPANPAGIGSGGAVNTGNFARRWRAVRLPDGAELRNDAPYSAIVDPAGRYGRRPGSKFPPRAELIAWILRRLLTRAPQRRRRQGPRGAGEKQREAAEKKRLQRAIRDVAAGRKPRAPGAAAAGDGGGRRRGPSAADQAARLYFPIARAIARRGLLGRRILHDFSARAAIIDFVRADVWRELDREASKP